MAQPYVGEIRMFGGDFAPADWHLCDGTLLPISENETLFQLIGTTYGGDGQSNFGVPDLRGRLPVHQGSGFVLGQSAGVESVTLTVAQLPAHGHPLQASTNPADTPNVQSALPATGSVSQLYWGDPPDTQLAAQAISGVGTNLPHDNFQPYLCVSFIISLFGIFPPPN